MTQILFITLLLILPLAGCQSEPDRTPAMADGIHIEDPWARPAAEGRMSAIYLTLTQHGEPADTLMGASSEVASLVEIHESYEAEDGLMGMRHVEQVPLPADESVRLEQGGLHIMLIQLQQALTPGDQVELTLHFARAGDVPVQVPVQTSDSP